MLTAGQNWKLEEEDPPGPPSSQEMRERMLQRLAAHPGVTASLVVMGMHPAARLELDAMLAEGAVRLSIEPTGGPPRRRYYLCELGEVR